MKYIRITHQSFLRLSWALAFVCLAFPALAQKSKAPFVADAFTLPEGFVAGEDYIPGHIVFKVKPEYKAALQDANSLLSRSVQQMATVAPEPTFNEKSFRKQQFRNGKPSVDMTLFYDLKTSVVLDVEKAINELLATGMVEYAEPRYLYKLAYDPNDPEIASQYYINAINAPQAWDITKGDTTVVIGIVDSGFDFAHPDLEPNYAYNWDDPIDGIDNDEDGYVDNFQGWDFVGSSIDNPTGDNNPQLEDPGIDHGIQGAGCASAATDNGEGIAGVGFNCRILATKHADTNNRLTIGFGYDGVVYMAEQGADIINCSWGGTTGSQFAQEVIDYVVKDLGCVVVAAAGNSGQDELHYPSAYEGVLAVGASDQFSGRANFSTHGFWVDVMAPGQSIWTTSHSRGDVYSGTQGTSFSSPIAAGAAGLVLSHYPDFTPEQVVALIKSTANPVIYDNESSSYDGKLGNGILDIGRALSVQPPSVRVETYSLVDGTGAAINAGEEGVFSVNLKNFLWDTEADFTATLSVNNSNVEILTPTLEAGVIAQGETREYDAAFQVRLKSGTRQNERVLFRIDYAQSGGFQDFEYIEVLINPSFAIVDKNNISFSIDSEGTVGHHAEDREEGIGFVFNGEDILYEMGLVLGTSDRRIASSCRTGAGAFSQHFRSITLIREIEGAEDDHHYYEGEFSDANAGSRRPNVHVRHSVRVWPDEANYAILEYHITNTGSEPLTPFYVGLFADWDVQSYFANRADYREDLKLGYVYSALEGEYCGGMQLLSSDKANAMGINNNQDALESPFGIYDDFTNSEKFQSISSGTEFVKAGFVTNTDTDLPGHDVSNTVASGPHVINPEQTLTVAFAVMAAEDVLELQSTAIRAEEKYAPYLITGLEDAPEAISRSLRIFPNPAQNAATLLMEDLQESARVEVLTPMGQVLSTQEVAPQLGQQQVKLDLAGYAAGLYLVRVTDANGHSAVLRLTKN